MHYNQLYCCFWIVAKLQVQKVHPSLCEQQLESNEPGFQDKFQ